MRLLDLFCGAGGAAVGYHRAGFEVVGVDHLPQKHFPFPFVLADALEYVRDHGHEYDAIHGSPPCQAHSDLKAMWNAKQHADLVAPTREFLVHTRLPYIIENVPGAPLKASVMLCGTMFDLGVNGAELWRHRYFETNFSLPLTPPCSHYSKAKVIGVYGGHGRDGRRVVGVYGHCGGKSVRDGTQQFSVSDRRLAMGIAWMNGAELSQAIPPAYTEFIGRQLMRHLTQDGGGA